jgi:hypothetical protein
MIIWIKLFPNSKLYFIQTVKFVKQLFRIQIQKGGKVLLWNQVKSKMEACYSELILRYLVLFAIKSQTFYWVSVPFCAAFYKGDLKVVFFEKATEFDEISI